MIEYDKTSKDGAQIRVIGIGGGGGNAINNMISRGLTGVDFIAANTDSQALAHNLAAVKLQVGKDSTRGLGCGANPEIGKKAIEENYEDIKEALKNSDMVFITGGMGGGTGTGGAPMIAKIAQELGALVVGIVTKPFDWEGRKRKKVADNGISDLREHVDALISIPNQRLLDIIDKNTSFGEAFQKVDEVLYNATRGIADIISRHGIVNVDFADVKTIMKGMGDALMGIGTASGENRAEKATENALSSPLLDGISIEGAQGVLVNITGGSDLTMHEVADAVSIVEQAAGEDVNLIHGVVYNAEPTDEIMVTVVATGFVNNNRVQEEIAQEAVPENLVQETQNKAQFNSKQMQIAYNEQNNNEQANYRNGFPIGFNGRIPLDKNSRNEELLKSPKGTNQLKKYDEPAYIRRDTMIEEQSREQFDNGLSRIEKLRERVVSNSSEKYREEERRNQKPAFLRKIMD